MTRKRSRKRASEIANLRPRGRFVSIFLIAVALGLIIFFKVSMSDESTDVFEYLVGDPELELPKSASEVAQLTRDLGSSEDADLALALHPDAGSADVR